MTTPTRSRRPIEDSFRRLKERTQEGLFLHSVELKIDRSWIGRRLLAAVLFTYQDLGRPGRHWSKIRDYLVHLNDENLSFQLGYLQLEFGMVKESIATFQELLDRALLRDATVDPLLISNLIDALNGAGEYSDAIHVFENVLPKIPLSGPKDTIHYNAANSFYGEERFTEAARCYRIALCIRTSNRCHILHNLGNCYSEMGDEASALEWYKHALDEATTDSERGVEEYAIGRSSAELGRRGDALAYYRRAADRGHTRAAQKIAQMSLRCRDVRTDAMHTARRKPRLPGG